MATYEILFVLYPSQHLYVGPMWVIHGLQSGAHNGLSMGSIRAPYAFHVRLHWVLGGAQLCNMYKAHPSPSLKFHVALKVFSCFNWIMYITQSEIPLLNNLMVWFHEICFLLKHYNKSCSV